MIKILALFVFSLALVSCGLNKSDTGLPDQLINDDNANSLPLSRAEMLANFENENEYQPGEIIVKYKENASMIRTAANGDESVVSMAEALSEEHMLALESDHEDFNIAIMKLKYDGDDIFAAAEELLDDPNIEYIEPNYKVYATAIPNDPRYGELWGLQKIEAVKAWEISPGTSEVLVGVLDTGVDYTHEDLKANIFINSKEIAGNGIDDDGNGYIDDTHGWNFAGNNNNPMADDIYQCDQNGNPVKQTNTYHGTHVTGTIAGAVNNGIGVAGVAQKIKILPLKFLNRCGSGDIGDAIEAIAYAIKMKVKIINNSWGGPGDSQALLDAIKSAERNGILFVAAAGNGGSDQIGDNNEQSPNYPSNYNVANILAVAATDQRDELTIFSNYSKKLVHVAAPGLEILSTKNGNAYQSMGGTSMATPQVVGLAALLLSYKSTLTVAELKSIIIDSVDKVSALSSKVSSGGRINAYKAMKLVSGGATDPALPTAAQPLMNEKTYFEIYYYKTDFAINFNVKAITGASQAYYEILKANATPTNRTEKEASANILFSGTIGTEESITTKVKSYPIIGAKYCVRVAAINASGALISNFSECSTARIIRPF